jgi:hypothetical protein
MWFCIYFAVTFCLINIYSLYTSWLTWSDKTTSVLPQWSIMFMQVRCWRCSTRFDQISR